MFTKWKIIGALAALVMLGTPGFLGYRYVKGVIEDNKTLTGERDLWKQRAVYWHGQFLSAEKRIKEQQATMNLLAQNRTSATQTQRRVTNAFKQSPASSAVDATRAANDAFGLLACSTGGPCRSSQAPAAGRPPRP